MAGVTASAVLGETFERNGFVIVPNLITKAEAGELKKEVVRVVSRYQDTMGHGVDVGLSAGDEIFRNFARDPRLLDVIESLIGPNIMFWSDKAVLKDKNIDFGTPWHQDWAYWKGAHKVTLWLALDDVDESNGCLKLVAGSHKREYSHESLERSRQGFKSRITPEEAERDPSRIVSAPVSAGSAVIFHDLTLHASYPCKTGQDRYAIAISYKDPTEEDLEYPELTAAAVVRGKGR